MDVKDKGSEDDEAEGGAYCDYVCQLQRSRLKDIMCP